MKKFFTSIPLQVGNGLGKYKYNAEDNSLLQADFKTSFPITTAINGYVGDGEAFQVIVIDSDSPAENLDAFRNEIKEICTLKGSPEAELIVVKCDTGEGMKGQAALLKELIKNIDENDELFCCITYGVKPQTVALLTAIQCGYQIRKNTTIDCVVYGEIKRPSNDASTWTAHVYDMTAIIKMTDVVRMLSAFGTADPDAVIEKLFDL